MTWFEVMGVVATSALLLPIITIISLRLAWYKSFPALLFYYIIVFSQNLVALGYFPISRQFVHNYGVLNNLLDAPLMLTFMTYFSKTVSFRKKMKWIIPSFVVFEILVIAIVGFNNRSMVLVSGPGLLLVLYFSTRFFIHQAKITIVHQKAAGKAFIASALLFAYGGYSFIYVVYFLLKTPYITDTFIVYYLVSIVSSLTLSAGIIIEKRRVRQLAELQTARKELKIVYGRGDAKAPHGRPSWKNL